MLPILPIVVSDQPQLGDQVFALNLLQVEQVQDSDYHLRDRVTALELSLGSMLRAEQFLILRVEQLEARTLAARWVRLSLWVQTVWGRLWR